VLELQKSEFNNRHSSFIGKNTGRGFQDADENKTIALSRCGPRLLDLNGEWRLMIVDFWKQKCWAQELGQQIGWAASAWTSEIRIQHSSFFIQLGKHEPRPSKRWWKEDHCLVSKRPRLFCWMELN